MNFDDALSGMLRVGRLHAPAWLYDHADELEVTSEEMARLAAHAWTLDEYPSRTLPLLVWALWFMADDPDSDYWDGDRFGPRPSSPLTLYRGATEERALDTSWTPSLDIAQTFANGVSGRPVGRVWVAEVDPHDLIAHVTDRDEDEYIVDPIDLHPRPFDGVSR